MIKLRNTWINPWFITRINFDSTVTKITHVYISGTPHPVNVFEDELASFLEQLEKLTGADSRTTFIPASEVITQ
jgi:hypothetical protein